MNVYRFLLLLAFSDHSYFLIDLLNNSRFSLSFVSSYSINFPPATNPQISTHQGPQSIVEENLSHHSLQICVCRLKPYYIIYKPVSQSTAIIFLQSKAALFILSFFSTSPTHHALNNVHLPFTIAPEKRDHQGLPSKELVQYVLHSLSFFSFINFSRIDNCLYS